MRALRIRFKKTGRAKYISHLDVNRLMSRAVRRAGIPIWYTEGFNPHPYLGFPLPLSLGQESDVEIMDIKVEDGCTNEEITERLNAVMPEGVEITEVYDPFCDIHEIDTARYEIAAECEDEDTARTLTDEISALVDSGEIISEKTGKKGRQKVVKQINLCEFIRDFFASAEKNTINIGVTLPAGERININPSLLTAAFSSLKKAENLLFSIKRTQIFTKDGSIFR